VRGLTVLFPVRGRLAVLLLLLLVGSLACLGLLLEIMLQLLNLLLARMRIRSRGHKFSLSVRGLTVLLVLLLVGSLACLGLRHLEIMLQLFNLLLAREVTTSILGFLALLALVEL